MAVAVDAAFASYDFLISPVAPITAFPAELAYPTDDPLKPFEHIAFTVPYNMSAHPAATVNCGYSTTGLPIGLQVAAPRFHDHAVLRLAAALTTLLPAARAWPTP
jgi:aspartyl-tRNA(Asn)/glutamyl-tRNA(Gln) amidotransferase subunit A